MNAQKMTQKSLEALQAAQSLAVEYENQALAPEHLFCALLNQQDGLIPQLFQKMGAEPGNVAAPLRKRSPSCRTSRARGAKRTKYISRRNWTAR